MKQAPRSDTNGQLLLQLQDALACLKHLARRGCTVRQIAISQRARAPRIEIAPPPPRARLHGGRRLIDRTGPRPIDVWATRLEGCQVEWRVRP